MQASTSDGDKFITTLESVEPAQGEWSQSQVLNNTNSENSSSASTSRREGVSFLHALLLSFVNILLDSNLYCVYK